MKVSAHFAETHLDQLFSAARTGEEVEIADSDHSSFRLMLVRPAPAMQQGRRILGAGRGKMRIPAWEEWKAMDREIEREMCDVPFVSSGEL